MSSAHQNPIGQPVCPETAGFDATIAAWQRGYIELFLDAVSSADWSDPEQARASVVARMKAYELSEELQFLMELSIEPVALKQGLLAIGI